MSEFRDAKILNRKLSSLNQFSDFVNKRKLLIGHPGKKVVCFFKLLNLTILMESKKEYLCRNLKK